jgi:integrase/recombinase XerD
MKAAQTIEELKAMMPDYIEQLKSDEKAAGTITKYSTDIIQAMEYLEAQGGEPVEKQDFIDYKQHLGNEGLKTSTINGKVVSLNNFLKYAGRQDLTVKGIKTQRRNTLDDAMTRSDYERIMRMAQTKGETQIYYLMMALGATGIRINELPAITFEAVKAGRADIYNKGKIRTISIPADLAKQLKKYAKAQGITAGPLFINRYGQPLKPQWIWRKLKEIAGQARVKKSKIHAHSFRHLFAREFLDAGGQITQLADILGHSSINTTMIYSRSSEADNRRAMDQMGLTKIAKKNNRTSKNKKARR